MLNMLNIYKDGWNENNAYIFGFIMADGCLLPYKKNEKIVMSSNDLGAAAMFVDHESLLIFNSLRAAQHRTSLFPGY